MKIATYNIRYGLGLDQKIDLRRIAATIADADIVCLQEVDRFWKRSGMVDQPKSLGALLPQFYWAYFPAYDVDASEIDSNGAIINRRRQFGPMLLSKWSIASVRHIVLPQLPTWNVLGMATGALEGVIDCPTGAVRIYSVHLSSASSAERCMQVEALTDMDHMIQHCGSVITLDRDPDDPGEAASYAQMQWSNAEPYPPIPQHTVIAGDFNCTDDSPEYALLAGEPDPVYGYGIICGSIVDSWKFTAQRSGGPNTWQPDPPIRPPGRPLRLDYCFTNTEMAQQIKRVWVDDQAIGSDHKPYWVEFDA